MQRVRKHGGNSSMQGARCADTGRHALHLLSHRYLQLNVALVAAGRQEVIAQLQTFSLDTLQSEPSFLEAATQSTMRVAPHLGLTEQQACVIATGGQGVAMLCYMLGICSQAPACMFENRLGCLPCSLCVDDAAPSKHAAVPSEGSIQSGALEQGIHVQGAPVLTLHVFCLVVVSLLQG